MLLLFGASYVHNNNIAYIGLFLVFGVSFVSVIIGRINIKKAKYKPLPQRVFANSWVDLKLIKDGEFFADVKSRVFLKKRGFNKIKLKVKSDYPLKLAYFIKEIEVELLVYPQLKGKSLLSYGKDMEFRGLKKYYYDEPKYIHWPSFAKGDLQVKVFGSEGEGESVFYYEKIPGDKESKISQLALWAYEGFKNGVKFKIIFPDKEISYKEGFDEVFKTLATY